MNCSLSRLVGRLVQIGIDRKEVLDDRRALDLASKSCPQHSSIRLRHSRDLSSEAPAPKRFLDAG
jgi:hypothetical protein